MKKKIFFLIFFVIVIGFLASVFSYLGVKAYKEAKYQRMLIERKKQTWMQLKTEVAKEAIGFQGELGVLINVYCGWLLSPFSPLYGLLIWFFCLG